MLNKKQFAELRKQMEEHLSSINDNTSEIQSMFDYLHELEVKIDKLNQRVEQAQLNQGDIKPAITSLDQTEKNVFLVLYTEEIPLSYKEIAEKASLPLAMIPECISSLISKGIPFQRSFYNGQLFLKVDPRFKDVHAKENLVNVSLQSYM